MIKLAQSYLISAPSQQAADAEAEKMIASVLCREGTACGVCDGCKKLASRDHIDLLIIETKEQALKVEDVYSVAAFLRLKPVEAPRRCIWLREAHKMTPAVQNKLLKALEDPPPNTLFTLTTDRPEALLPTVRSRCIPVNIKADTKDLPQAVTQREIIARAVCGGFIQQEQALLADEEYFELRADALAACRRLCDKRFSPVELASKLCKYDKRINESILIMACCVRDAAYTALSVGYDTAPDSGSAAEYMAQSFTAQTLCRILEILICYSGKKNICPTLGARLMCEAMLSQILEVING